MMMECMRIGLEQWCQDDFGIDIYGGMRDYDFGNCSSTVFPDECKFKEGTSLWYGLKYTVHDLGSKGRLTGKLRTLLVLLAFLACNILSLRVLKRMKRHGAPVYPLQILIIQADVLILLIGLSLYYPIMYFFGISAVSKWCFSWKGWALRQTMVLGMGAGLNAQFVLLLACWDRNQALKCPLEFKFYNHHSRARRFGAAALLAAFSITFLTQQETEFYRFQTFRFGPSQQTIEQIYCRNPRVLTSCYLRSRRSAYRALTRFINYEWHNIVCLRQFRFPWLQNGYPLTFLIVQAAIVYFAIRLAIRYRRQMKTRRSLLQSSSQKWSKNSSAAARNRTYGGGDPVGAGGICVSQITVVGVNRGHSVRVGGRHTHRAGHSGANISSPILFSGRTPTVAATNLNGNYQRKIETRSTGDNDGFPRSLKNQPRRQQGMNGRKTTPLELSQSMNANGSAASEMAAGPIRMKARRSKSVALTRVGNETTILSAGVQNPTLSRARVKSQQQPIRGNIPASERLLTTVVLANCLVAALFILVFTAWALCNAAANAETRNYPGKNSHRSCRPIDHIIYAVLIVQLMTNFFANLVLSKSFRHYLKKTITLICYD